MSKEQTHIGYRTAKAIGWFLLVLVILAGLIRLSLKTNLVHNFAKNQVESIANNFINGQLSIHSIEGDLWNDFTLNQTTITQQDTLLGLKKVRISFNPWALTRSTFEAYDIQVSGLDIAITEIENQNFDIQNLIPEDTSGTESSFRFNIHRLTVDRSRASVYAPSYLPDSVLFIDEINLSAGLSYQNDISATLSSLTFKLMEGSLPGPVALRTSASYQDKYISLNDLVLETGRSMIRASGNTSLRDSTANLEAVAQPFSLLDIQNYIDDYPLPDEQLDLSISVSGRMDSLNIELNGDGTGFDDLLIVSNLTIAETPVLNMLGFSAKNIDADYFTSNSIDAEIGELTGSVEGSLTSNLPSAHLTWGFTLYNVRYESYMFEIMFGAGTLINENLLANFEIKNGEDQITVNPEITSIFSDEPSWTLSARMENVNPGWWLRNEQLDGNVSLRATAEGQGLTLSENRFSYSIREKESFVRNSSRLTESGFSYKTVTDTITIANQKISGVDISGIISKDSLTADGYIQFIDDRVNFSTALANYTTDAPTYSYSLEAKDFKSSEIHGVDDIQTSINLFSEGNGKYFDPEQLTLNTTLKIDSSLVNGAAIHRIHLNVDIDNKILTISEGEVVSEIVEGTISGQRNIEDRYDPSNELTVNMQLNNIQPFANLLGVEILNANGNINGRVRESDTDGLLFDGALDLREIRYDTLASAETITGRASVAIDETFGYTFNLDISKPTYNGFDLQDINFRTIGSATSDSVSGGFELEIDGEQSGNISQSGQYALNLQNEALSLNWDVFDLETPVKVLSLESPFKLHYQNATIQTDTLKLNSGQGTFLHLAIPYADSLRQQIWAEGENFNFGVIQDIILDERFVDGILSGSMNLQNSPEVLYGDGHLNLTNLSYQETEIDTVNLQFSLVEERLQAGLSVIIDGNEQITGSLDIPFVPDNPENLSDAFFEEPINGQLTINPVDLAEFETLLSSFQITGTKGILSFQGELTGSAKEPDFDGTFKLKDPILSGIRIDSASAQVNYHHIEKNLTVRSEVIARGQRAASIFADLPLSMDFQTFEINTPGPTDSLAINILTNDFNISVFNDFLNREYLTRLRGTLNANLEMSGTSNNLVSKGYLRLSGGEVTVPIAGIRLTGISSDFSFTEGGVRLNSLRANSGSGSFSANGTIAMEGITPTELNINAEASRFRLANTDDYNLIIGLKSTLKGPPTRPTASGNLTVNNGFVYLQNFGERSVETIVLDDEDTSSFSPYDSLTIDMNFIIQDNFQVRNSRYLDLQVSLSGNLEAQKQSDQELQLFGTLTAKQGYARPLGKQFNLEEGQFTFSGPIDEPQIYINTSYIPQSSQKEGDPIILYYIIEGRGMEPEFRFESDPQMEQQDIICYTIFNKPCYALESWQQVVSGGSGTSPTDLLVGVLLDEVESLATRELGIDVVQIDNSRSGSGEGTSITTGWYLNRRTFFAIVNQISGSTPETLFILEYMLKNNLDLIITQGDDSRQGIDLRWQFDY